MLMVEVGEAPQRQACQEEEEAWAHSWDHLLHSWTATEGWQAGPETCCRFCLLEEAVGEGLICRVGPSQEEGVSHWAGEEEGRNVQMKVREVQMKRGTNSAVGALGFRHCHWNLEAGEEGQACWVAAAEVAPVRRRKAAGWKAPGACCSEGEEEAPLPCGWRACCPLEEAEEGVCHPRPCSGWVAGEACWRRARRSLTGSDVWSLLQKQHLGFQGKGEESAQGWAAWEPQALGGTPGCADLTEWVLVYWVLAGERYQALSPRQALGEAFGSSEALGVHFCGLEKARGTSLGHLGARKVWQMWLFLLVAKLGVGLLQNQSPCWLWIAASAFQPGTALPSRVVHPRQSFLHRRRHHHHRHRRRRRHLLRQSHHHLHQHRLL